MIRAIMLAGLLSLVPLAGGAMSGESGRLSLVDAVQQGNRGALQALLSGRSKTEIAAEGAAALILAASRNDLEMVDLLLAAGADPKAANEYGATALYAAAGTESAMTEKLLAAGADANAHLLSGETPLMEAARRGNLATVQALLAAGAEVNARETNGGQDALMWALAQRHANVAAELVRHGADVHASSQAGFTPLMFAAQQGDAASARILLKAGAKANDVMPKTGLTPLLIACAMGRAPAAALLLEAGADPNAVDANGYTALHYAALRKGAVAIVSALLAHGAKPDVRLVQKKPTVTPNGVILRGATPLALAAEINNLAVVKALVDGGADTLIPTDLGTTPLMLAAGAGTDTSRSRSPEERAVAIETVKLLVERGADVNAAGQFGWTAMHAAAYQGLNDVIEFLAAKGAGLDTKDGFGQTPLSIANAILTRGLGNAYYQTPRALRRDTADLLLRLGATPLERSGIVAVDRRAGE